MKCEIKFIFKKYEKDFIEILHTSKSIKEFKDRYSILQEKMRKRGELAFSLPLNSTEYKAKFKEIEEEYEQKKAALLGIEYKKPQEANLQENETINKEENATTTNFKAIQGESKNKETYKDEIKQNFFLNFLEAQKEQGVDILEILDKLQKNKIDIKI